MTCENPTVPIINGVNGIPPRRYILPKSYLGDPDKVSIPILASKIPNIVITSPFVGFSPTSQLIDVIAINKIAVISEGPNFRPISARAGPISVRMQIPIVPPINDAIFAVMSACPGLFLFVAIGYPSSAVITAGESPGMFRRIALKLPPYIFE